MVEMSDDNKFKKVHDELYIIVETLQNLVKRVVIIKEHLHTLDGSQTRMDEYAGNE